MKKKLNLNELKVNSFTTTALNGGAADPITVVTDDTDNPCSRAFTNCLHNSCRCVIY